VELSFKRLFPLTMEPIQIMKIQFLFKSLALTVVAMCTVISLNAQSTSGKTSKAPTKPKTETSEAAEDAAMEKDLKLTPSQKAEFKKANEDYKAKSKAIKSSNKEELAKLREERKRAHRAALSPEQAKRYDEMVAKREARKGEKRAEKAGKKAEKKGAKKERKATKEENKAIKKELDKN
jgi:hypothetical protein